MTGVDLLLGGLKFLHIAGVVVWAGGLLYMPALLLAHRAATNDDVEFVRIRHTSRFAFTAIVSPAALVAIAAGTALLFVADVLHGWMFLKLAAVLVLAIAHLQFGSILRRYDHSHYETPRWFVLAIAVLALLSSLAVLWLVLGQPFVPVSWLPDWMLRPGGLGDEFDLPTPI